MPSKAKITTKRGKDIRNIYEGYTKDNYTFNLSLTYFLQKKRVYQFSDTLVFLRLICVYSTCFFCGIMRFNITPTKADRPMPLIVKLP